MVVKRKKVIEAVNEMGSGGWYWEYKLECGHWVHVTSCATKAFKTMRCPYCEEKEVKNDR